MSESANGAEAGGAVVGVTQVINPATEEVIAAVGQTSAEDTDAAIARAHRALPAGGGAG
jgi:acyl-CoA reductase-like NAD-dependent aldehyde dehydrogenase